MSIAPDFETFCREVLQEPISRQWAMAYGSPPRDDEELATWRTISGQEEFAPRICHQRVFVKGRRSGGTKTACKRIVYRIHTGDYQRFASKGERLHAIITAQDRDTGNEIKSYFENFYANPFLRSEVVDIFRDRIVLRNGFVISVKTCSFRAPRGISCPLGICDEIGVWRVNGSNIDRSVVRSLTPSMVQFPDRELILLGTPWIPDGLLHEALTHPFERVDRAVFHCPTALMIRGQSNASAIEAELAIEKAADQASFEREFECKWLADGELRQFISAEDIEAAVGAWRELPPAPEPYYLGALDASGLSGGDRFVFGIAHSDKTGAKVSVLRGWHREPVAQVMDEIATLCKSFRIRTVIADQFSFSFVAELLRQREVGLEQLTFSARSKPALYFDLKNLLAQGSLQLPNNSEMVRELRALESVRASNGNYKIGAPRSGGIHDDYCATLAILANKLKRSSRKLFIPFSLNVRGGGRDDDRFWHKQD